GVQAVSDAAEDLAGGGLYGVNGAVSFTCTGSISRFLRLTSGSRSRRGIGSAEREHRLARVLTGDQVGGDVGDLAPRLLHADVRRELARSHQVGEPAQPDRGRLRGPLGEEG